MSSSDFFTEGPLRFAEEDGSTNLTQDKISTRRAAVLAHITNQLLRTLPAIAKEENRDETTIIFDMPGPDRDRPAPDQNPPQHAGVTSHATNNAMTQDPVPA